MDSTIAESGTILWGLGWGGWAMIIFVGLVIAAVVKAVFFNDKKSDK